SRPASSQLRTGASGGNPNRRFACANSATQAASDPAAIRRSRGATPGPILLVSRHVDFDSSSDRNRVCNPVDCVGWVVAVMTGSFRLLTHSKERTAAIHTAVRRRALHRMWGVYWHTSLVGGGAEVLGSSRFCGATCGPALRPAALHARRCPRGLQSADR